jgi:hypothetical protein
VCLVNPDKGVSDEAIISKIEAGIDRRVDARNPDSFIIQFEFAGKATLGRWIP